MALREAPPPAAVKALQAAIKGREVVQAKGRHAYFLYPDGIGTSKLTIKLIEKKSRHHGHRPQLEHRAQARCPDGEVMTQIKKSLLAALFVSLPLMAHAQSPIRPDADPRVAEDRRRRVARRACGRCSTTLVSFGTRETLSNQDVAPRAASARARQWIFDELTRSSPRLQVSFDTHRIAPQGRITRQVELRNVMAVLPGKSPRRIYISGHYDSLNLGERRPGRRSTPAPAARTRRRAPSSTTTPRRPAPTTTAAARC